jgi:hypothetical protein
VARLRTLKPEFFTHELLAELSPLDRLFYQGLWCYADREGRLEDRPKYLKTVILPYDDHDADAALSRIASKGFIVRYVVGERRLIAIPAFMRHQKPHPNERQSELPPPSEADKTPVKSMSLLSSTKDILETYQGTSQQGGLGDLCLGDIGLGDCGDPSVAHSATAPPIPGPTNLADRRKPRESADDLKALWDERADRSLSRWKTLDDKRRKAANGALRERRLRDGPESWLAVFELLNASPFLLGQNDRGWRADLDWLLKPGRAARVLEGAYSGGATGATKGRASEADRDWSRRTSEVDEDGQVVL